MDVGVVAMGGLIGRAAAPLLGLALAAALLGLAWHWRQASQARISLAEFKATHERQAREALQDQQTRFQRTLKTQQEALDAEQIKRVAAEGDARRAVAAGLGLQQQLAATRDRFAAGDPEAAGRCQAAGETAAMLAELLGRCSERRRELAIFADRAYGAGALCQQLSEATSE